MAGGALGGAVASDLEGGLLDEEAWDAVVPVMVGEGPGEVGEDLAVPVVVHEVGEPHVLEEFQALGAGGEEDEVMASVDVEGGLDEGVWGVAGPAEEEAQAGCLE